MADVDKGSGLMGKGKRIKKVRIFVASPENVQPERKCLEKLVEGFNRSGDMAEQAGLTFEVLDWKEHSAADDREAGQVDRAPVEKWDIFIGIIWLRFSKHDDLDAENGSQCGAEEEFKRAYGEWKQFGRPNVVFYRCHRPLPPSDIDIDQLKKVQGFFEQFERDGQHPGIYHIFEDTSEFEHLIRENLIDHLKRFESKSLLSIGKLKFNRGASDGRITLAPGEAIEKELKPGKVYKFALLSVDIVDHSKLFKTYQFGELKTLLDKFYDFVFATIRSFKGDQISWAGDGGIFCFWGEGACDNAVLAGIKLMLEIMIFNLSNKITILKENIRLRLAGHYGPVDFEFPTEKIHSSHINFVAHLEKNGTSPESFSVGKCLRDELSDCIKDILTFEKKFQNTYIYTYRLPTEKGHISRKELEDTHHKIKSLCANLSENIRLAVASKSDSFDYEAMRRNIDSIYNSIEFFTKSYSNVDENWSQEYFKTLINYVKAFLAEDLSLSKKVDALYYKSDEDMMRNPDLLDMVKFIGVRRTNAIPSLKLLLKRFEYYSSGEKDTKIIAKEELMARIDNLIKADEFSEEMAFFELFLNDKDELIEYISNCKRDERYNNLVSRLWKMADFVLIEDVTLRGKHSNKRLALIFPVLCQDPKKGNYFKIVLQLFQENLEANVKNMKKLILGTFQDHEIKPTATDIIIVLKCLLVGCMEQDTRKKLVGIIGFKRLWEIVSYSETPIEVIHVIADHLYEKKEDDLMKIFFDLTLNKLFRIINIAKRENALHQVMAIIIVFYSFDFFAETGYFERLEDLRLKFASKCKNYPNADLDIMDNYFGNLKERRDKGQNMSASIPRGVGDIPLPIQRRLANEGRYVKFFINSPHNLIALDTIRYINVKNIEHVLRSHGVNEVLLGWLLKNRELFKRTSTVALALNHPRCNMAFAIKNINRLSGEQLKTVAENTFSNRDVRNYASKILKRLS
ncbi:MAG: hypothetical protein GY765_39370 [bacterium]|nr:hypothetical protein [bacterium]